MVAKSECPQCKKVKLRSLNMKITFCAASILTLLTDGQASWAAHEDGT